MTPAKCGKGARPLRGSSFQFGEPRLAAVVADLLDDRCCIILVDVRDGDMSALLGERRTVVRPMLVVSPVIKRNIPP